MSDAAFDALCEAYYIDNQSGGNLHIVLDDRGTSDSCLHLCAGEAALDGDFVGLAIAAEMLRMPEDDRQAYHDFVDARAKRRAAGEPDDLYPTFAFIQFFPQEFPRPG